MKHLFATRPISEFDDYSSSHLNAGEQYQRRFRVLPGRALMWELEKRALQDTLAGLAPRRILDFACGTGRISSFIENLFPEASVHGIDIAESMLAAARKESLRTDYRRMDSREAIAAFGEQSFDLVLAFRFFANAEPALRASVAADLARLVVDGGSLILNNHRNFWSTSYVGRRILGQKPLGALNADIEGLFTEQGFDVRRKLSLGLWPQGDTKSALLPWRAVEPLERVNLAAFASHHTIGYNTLWVLTKSRAPASVTR